MIQGEPRARKEKNSKGRGEPIALQEVSVQKDSRGADTPRGRLEKGGKYGPRKSSFLFNVRGKTKEKLVREGLFSSLQRGEDGRGQAENSEKKPRKRADFP